MKNSKRYFNSRYKQNTATRPNVRHDSWSFQSPLHRPFWMSNNIEGIDAASGLRLPSFILIHDALWRKMNPPKLNNRYLNRSFLFFTFVISIIRVPLWDMSCVHCRSAVSLGCSAAASPTSRFAYFIMQFSVFYLSFALGSCIFWHLLLFFSVSLCSRN